MKLEKLLIRRLKKLAMFADMNGFALVADADGQGVRVMAKEKLETADDLRKEGVLVPLHEGCGGGIVSSAVQSGFESSSATLTAGKW